MGQLTNTQPAPPLAGSPSSSTAALPFAALERLVDQAAVFNAFILPEPAHASTRNNVFDIPPSQRLHRFSADVKVTGSCVKASNEIGEILGTIDQRWTLVPDDYVAGPRYQPAQVPFNPAVSQRFVMQEVRVSFGQGSDGFVGFGTGRTFPSQGSRGFTSSADYMSVLDCSVVRIRKVREEIICSGTDTGSPRLKAVREKNFANTALLASEDDSIADCVGVL